MRCWLSTSRESCAAQINVTAATSEATVAVPHFANLPTLDADISGMPDSLGRIMQVTEVAVADELAAAAELVMGKSSGIPVAVVRGVEPEWLRDATMAELIRPPAEDLFR